VEHGYLSIVEIVRNTTFDDDIKTHDMYQEYLWVNRSLCKSFYLKSRSRDFGHAPFGVFHYLLSFIIHYLAMVYPTKKKTKSLAKVMEGGVPESQNFKK